MNVTHTEVAQEIKDCLPTEGFFPSTGLHVAGDHVRIEARAHAPASAPLGELVVVVRPLHPLASTHPALLKAAKDACAEVIQQTGESNPSVSERAREWLQMCEPGAVRIEDEALDLQWFEIEQDGPRGSFISRRCSDSSGRAVFPNVLLDRPVVLRAATMRGRFYCPAEHASTGAPMPTSPSEFDDALTYFDEALGVMARLERRGESASLFFVARGEGWTSARAAWRFGQERGVLPLRPATAFGSFCGRVELRTPFSQARRQDPVFDLEPILLRNVVIQLDRDWFVKAAEELPAPRQKIPLAQAACVVGGVLISLAESIALRNFILGGQAPPLQMDFTLPLREPLSCRIVISQTRHGWLIELAIDSPAPPPLLAWQLIARNHSDTGMRSFATEEKLEVEAATMAAPWALEFEWMEGEAWRTHQVEFPPIRHEP